MAGETDQVTEKVPHQTGERGKKSSLGETRRNSHVFGIVHKRCGAFRCVIEECGRKILGSRKKNGRKR